MSIFTLYLSKWNISKITQFEIIKSNIFKKIVFLSQHKI